MKKITLILILLIVSIFIITACQNNVVEETTTAETVEVTTEAEEQISTITLPTPTFEYYASDKVVDLENGPFTLSLISSSVNEVMDVEKWFVENDLSIGQGQIDDMIGKILEYSDGTYTYRIQRAEEFRDEFINIYPYKILDIYSNDTEELLYSLDFTNYIFLPEYTVEDNDVQQNIVWAQIKDNILYISNSHYRYANITNNLNSFITAIDLSDMSILWRSDALVGNSYTFAIYEDVIFCGYGYTDEADYLYQIDLNNGKVLEKISVKTSPEYIIVKDSILYVRCFDTDYQFSIGE